jgi:hypothetical protein
MLGADAFLHGFDYTIDRTAEWRAAKSIRFPVDRYTRMGKAAVEEEEKAKDLVEGAHITSSSIEGGKYYDEEEAMAGSY